MLHHLIASRIRPFHWLLFPNITFWHNSIERIVLILILLGLLSIPVWSVISFQAAYFVLPLQSLLFYTILYKKLD